VFTWLSIFRELWVLKKKGREYFLAFGHKLDEKMPMWCDVSEKSVYLVIWPKIAGIF
jgi:hypothetical protein